MAGVGIGVLVIIAVAILLGAITQTTVGLGLGQVAAPVLTIVAPDLMPGAMIMVATVLPALTLVREHRDIDWRGLTWSIPSRVVGTVVGVWIVTRVDVDALELMVGLVVLGTVLLTIRTLQIPINTMSLSGGGFVSGVTGTATGIGGPPMALLYQHRPPHQVRSTMAVFFVVGSMFSLGGLGVSGELTTDELQVALALLPVLGLGVWLGTRLRTRLPLRVMRPALLAVSGTSAVVLIIKSFVG